MGFDFKVVVAGGFAAGKTTFIQAISDGDVVGTEVQTTGDEAAVKETTTVGVEFGTFRVPTDDLDIDLHLFGVPGQERFSAMWEIIAEGVDGLVLLVDGSRPETWDDARRVGEHFARTTDPPTIVGVNRADGGLDLVKVADAVGRPDDLVAEVDVLDPSSAKALLVDLLGLLLERMDDEVTVD